MIIGVTGFTGAIGGEVARKLLEDSAVDRVIIPVRARSLDEAKSRARQRMLASYHTWVHDWDRRIVVIPDGGPVSWPRDINIDCWVHCAFGTSFVDSAGWEASRGYSMDLIKSAQSTPTPPSVIYVSSAPVVQYCNSVVTEQSIPNPSNGYLRAKLSVERLFNKHCKSYCIVRVPIVIPDVVICRKMRRNMLWVIPACAKLGEIRRPNGTSDAKVDCMLLSDCAAGLARIATNHKSVEALTFNYALGNRAIATTDDLIHMVNELELYDKRILSVNEWSSQGRLSRAIDHYIPFLYSGCLYASEKVDPHRFPWLPRPTAISPEAIVKLLAGISINDAVKESLSP